MDHRERPHRGNAIGASAVARSFIGITVATALALASCARTSEPSAFKPVPPAEPPRGPEVRPPPEVMRKLPYAMNVKKTGVLARYPKGSPGPRGYDSAWLVFSDLGSATRAPSAVADLRPSMTSSATIEDSFARYDGKLVTVKGIAQDRSAMIGGGGWVGKPWAGPVWVDSIVEAPPKAQAAISWAGTLIRPGEWYRDERRLRLARGLARVSGDVRSGITKAEKALGRPVELPSSPKIGRLLGITTYGVRLRSRKEYTSVQTFDSGLDVSEVRGWTIPVLRRVRGSKANDPWPPLKLVDINGHPGYIEYRSSKTVGAYPMHLVFDDGVLRQIIYWGTPGKGPSEAVLLEIARSI